MPWPSFVSSSLGCLKFCGKYIGSGCIRRLGLQSCLSCGKLGFKIGGFGSCISSRPAHSFLQDQVELDLLSYEQTRRLVNGAALPSREALERICKILGADLKEMTTLLFAEKSQRVYGTDVVSEMTGKDPELAPIEASWPHLDLEQRAILIDIAKGMASRNRENTSAVDAMFNTSAWMPCSRPRRRRKRSGSRHEHFGRLNTLRKR